VSSEAPKPLQLTQTTLQSSVKEVNSSTLL
jgi:hypothetical protein